MMWIVQITLGRDCLGEKFSELTQLTRRDLSVGAEVIFCEGWKCGMEAVVAVQKLKVTRVNHCLQFQSRFLIRP